MRQCGDCTLCCKLLPVPPLNKKAGQRCQHQRRTGCRVYHKAGMPPECAVWNCRWLVEDDTDRLPRPDRAHYVIDILPDIISLEIDGERHDLAVVQIWIDPAYPDAHKDERLRAYIARRASEGIATLIRFDARRSLTIFAPSLSEDGEWHEIQGVGTPDYPGLWNSGLTA